MSRTLQIASDFVVMRNAFEADVVAVTDGRDQSTLLRDAGEFVIVPKGVWHTARVRELARMLFITPGQETDNQAQPPGRSD
ncbi:MAG: hypothetical protein K0U72_07985 [Gammaproteobacteria bacterium]|nr:hypothetical protein [Gammaproteobacteria bacterium]